MRAAHIAMIVGLLLLAGGCGRGQNPQPRPDAALDGDQQLAQANLSLDVAGAELQALEAQSGSEFSLDDYCRIAILKPKEVFRRIAPGDIPDGVVVGYTEFTGGCHWSINNLPLNEALLLQIVFQPDVDLATGEPFSAENPPRLYATHIPIECQEGGLLDVEVGIQLNAQPGGGYCGDALTALKEGGEVTAFFTRLDYGAGLVSRDCDMDGSFEDEAWLADEGRLGVSESLLKRLVAENDAAAAAQPVTLCGRLESIDETGGGLRLVDAQIISDAGREQLDELAVSFEEGTSFDLRLVNEHGESVICSPPAALSKVQPVTIRSELLGGLDGIAGGYWARNVEELQLNIPKDSVAVVPLRQAAAPGEPVPVTVYANQTANPLHEIDNLRIALEADNSYEAQSFNVGDRGGSATLADGVWTGIDTDGILLSTAARQPSADSLDDQLYVDVQLTPAGGGDLLKATGALFNFNLVCHTDSTPEVVLLDGLETATVFSDGARNSYTWRAKAELASGVKVSGQPLVLEIVDPPSIGSGTSDNPYLAEPGAQYQLRLLDPADGYVSTYPEVDYVLTALDYDKVTIEDAVLSIGAGYCGPIGVEAVYTGIHSRASSNPHLFVDSTAGFALNIHAAQTYIFGGSAADWELEFVPQKEDLLVKVNVQGAVDLRALYLDLQFDPALYYLDETRHADQAVGDGSIIMPPAMFCSMRASDGIIDYGQVLVNPQQHGGFSGEGMLVQFEFKRFPSLADSIDFQLPAANCADIFWDDGSAELRWRYLLPGDFNQDGRVFITSEGGLEYTDWTMLAIYFDVEGPFDPASIEYVIDRWDNAAGRPGSDGKIWLQEVTVIGQHYLMGLTGWNVYGGAIEDFPDGGELLDYVPFTAYHGDPLVERIWFSWTPAQAAGMTLWVRPELNGVAGEASEPVAVP